MDIVDIVGATIFWLMIYVIYKIYEILRENIPDWWEEREFVTFQDPQIGELRRVKIGWCWPCFFLSGVWGIPLFLRKLYIWGSVMVVIDILSLISPLPITMVLGMISLGLSIFLGMKGNEITAKTYLKLGWKVKEGYIREAEEKWGIAHLPKISE